MSSRAKGDLLKPSHHPPPLQVTFEDAFNLMHDAFYNRFTLQCGADLESDAEVERGMTAGGQWCVCVSLFLSLCLCVIGCRVVFYLFCLLLGILRNLFLLLLDFLAHFLHTQTHSLHFIKHVSKKFQGKTPQSGNEWYSFYVKLGRSVFDKIDSNKDGFLDKVLIAAATVLLLVTTTVLLVVKEALLLCSAITTCTETKTRALLYTGTHPITNTYH